MDGNEFWPADLFSMTGHFPQKYRFAAGCRHPLNRLLKRAWQITRAEEIRADKVKVELCGKELLSALKELTGFWKEYAKRPDERLWASSAIAAKYIAILFAKMGRPGQAVRWYDKVYYLCIRHNLHGSAGNTAKEIINMLWDNPRRESVKECMKWCRKYYRLSVESSSIDEMFRFVSLVSDACRKHGLVQESRYWDKIMLKCLNRRYLRELQDEHYPAAMSCLSRMKQISRQIVCGKLRHKFESWLNIKIKELLMLSVYGKHRFFCAPTPSTPHLWSRISLSYPAI